MGLIDNILIETLLADQVLQIRNSQSGLAVLKASQVNYKYQQIYDFTNILILFIIF